MLHVVMAWDGLGSIWLMGWWPRCWLCHYILSFVAEQFALICFLCLCCWLVGQSWAPDRTIWRPNPSSSHPMPAPKPLPHLFFPPNTHHHSSTSWSKSYFPPLPWTHSGYSVTIKVYHDAITVTLSRLIDNWSTIVHILIIFSLTVRSLIRYSAHQRGFGIGLYWRED